jgi:hypothetical protein
VLRNWPADKAEEEEEEYDAITPLPLIPGLKRVGSLPIVPSALEQRRDSPIQEINQYTR